MTTQTHYRLNTVAQLTKGEVTFKTADQKGRKTGYRWTITQLEVELLNDTTSCCYRTHTGNGPIPAIRVWGTPTRDGKGYGPAFNYTDVQTFEEATVLVAKRIAAAQKRDSKKFAA